MRPAATPFCPGVTQSGSCAEDARESGAHLVVLHSAEVIGATDKACFFQSIEMPRLL